MGQSVHKHGGIPILACTYFMVFLVFLPAILIISTRKMSYTTIQANYHVSTHFKSSAVKNHVSRLHTNGNITLFYSLSLVLLSTQTLLHHVLYISPFYEQPALSPSAIVTIIV